MQAIVYKKYGSTSVLALKEVAAPIPKDNEVLIKIHATSVNSWDWDLLRGSPFVVRLAGGGLTKPRKPILGCDIAGKITVIGKNVKRFKPGDDVFGDISQYGWGGFAEYVCVPEKALIKKPVSITFEEAAAIPQAGVMALQGIRDYGKVAPGKKVLINGAGGGVGTFAIQLAKYYGAEVTAVDHTNKLDFMLSLGADHVIDYTQEDVTQKKLKYDFILDVVGHHSIFDYKRILKPKGIYSMVGGHTSLIFQSLCIGPLLSIIENKKMGILAHQPNKGLDFLLSLIDKKNVTPIIERCYSLKEVSEALEHIGEGRVKGKIIITP